MNRSPAIEARCRQARARDPDPKRGRGQASGALALLLGLSGCGERPDSTSPETQASPARVAASGSAIPADYPLQTWMKGSAAHAMASGSSEALHQVFERIERLDPPGYPGWKSITSAGAAAARAGDIDGCRAACKSCHTQYRQAYREKDRGRALR